MKKGQEGQAESLHRGLSERHIRLMAMGMAIGVGLFLGSGTATQMAGPALLLSYAVGGIVVFFILRALGEMAVQQPLALIFVLLSEYLDVIEVKMLFEKPALVAQQLV